MREIKFRAWDKNTKKIIIDLPMVICYKAFWLYDELNNAMEYYGHGNDYILMQYTGLKDRNGKEIYEGDILKGNGGAEDFFFDIGFEEGCFIAKMPWIKNGEIYPELKAYCGFKEDFISIEVIGNIHENPELLEP